MVCLILSDMDNIDSSDDDETVIFLEPYCSESRLNLLALGQDSRSENFALPSSLSKILEAEEDEVQVLPALAKISKNSDYEIKRFKKENKYFKFAFNVDAVKEWKKGFASFWPENLNAINKCLILRKKFRNLENGTEIKNKTIQNSIDCRSSIESPISSASSGGQYVEDFLYDVGKKQQGTIAKEVLHLNSTVPSVYPVKVVNSPKGDDDRSDQLSKGADAQKVYGIFQSNIMLQEKYSSERGSKESLIDTGSKILLNDSSKIKKNLKDPTDDLLSHKRCTRFVEEKQCKDKNCRKLHKLPKDDHVLCKNFVKYSTCQFSSSTCPYMLDYRDSTSTSPSRSKHKSSTSSGRSTSKDSRHSYSNRPWLDNKARRCRSPAQFASTFGKTTIPKLEVSYVNELISSIDQPVINFGDNDIPDMDSSTDDETSSILDSPVHFFSDSEEKRFPKLLGVCEVLNQYKLKQKTMLSRASDATNSDRIVYNRVSPVKPKKKKRSHHSGSSSNKERLVPIRQLTLVNNLQITDKAISDNIKTKKSFIHVSSTTVGSENICGRRLLINYNSEQSPLNESTCSNVVDNLLQPIKISNEGVKDKEHHSKKSYDGDNSNQTVLGDHSLPHHLFKEVKEFDKGEIKTLGCMDNDIISNEPGRNSQHDKFYRHSKSLILSDRIEDNLCCKSVESFMLSPVSIKKELSIPNSYDKDYLFPSSQSELIDVDDVKNAISENIVVAESLPEMLEEASSLAVLSKSCNIPLSSESEGDQVLVDSGIQKKKIITECSEESDKFVMTKISVKTKLDCASTNIIENSNILSNFDLNGNKKKLNHFNAFSIQGLKKDKVDTSKCNNMLPCPSTVAEIVTDKVASQNVFLLASEDQLAGNETADVLNKDSAILKLQDQTEYIPKKNLFCSKIDDNFRNKKDLLRKTYDSDSDSSEENSCRPIMPIGKIVELLKLSNSPKTSCKADCKSQQQTANSSPTQKIISNVLPHSPAINIKVASKSEKKSSLKVGEGLTQQYPDNLQHSSKECRKNIKEVHLSKNELSLKETLPIRLLSNVESKLKHTSYKNPQKEKEDSIVKSDKKHHKSSKANSLKIPNRRTNVIQKSFECSLALMDSKSCKDFCKNRKTVAESAGKEREISSKISKKIERDSQSKSTKDSSAIKLKSKNMEFPASNVYQHTKQRNVLNVLTAESVESKSKCKQLNDTDKNKFFSKRKFDANKVCNLVSSDVIEAKATISSSPSKRLKSDKFYQVNVVSLLSPVVPLLSNYLISSKITTSVIHSKPCPKRMKKQILKSNLMYPNSCNSVENFNKMSLSDNVDVCTWKSLKYSNMKRKIRQETERHFKNDHDEVLIEGAFIENLEDPSTGYVEDPNMEDWAISGNKEIGEDYVRDIRLKVAHEFLDAHSLEHNVTNICQEFVNLCEAYKISKVELSKGNDFEMLERNIRRFALTLALRESNDIFCDAEDYLKKSSHVSLEKFIDLIKEFKDSIEITLT